MSVIMNTDGMIVDKELVDLANEVQKKFISLLDGKADWTTEQQIVASTSAEHAATPLSPASISVWTMSTSASTT